MILIWVVFASLHNRCNVRSHLGSNGSNSLQSCLCMHNNCFPEITSMKSRPSHNTYEAKYLKQGIKKMIKEKKDQQVKRTK